MADSFPIVACWGELVWDVFHLQTGESETELGGTAVNVATALVSSGAKAKLVSALGDDARGQAARAALDERGIDCAGLMTLRSASTATVEIRLDARGDATFLPGTRLDWSALDFTAPLESALSGAGALVFSLWAQRGVLSVEQLERALSRRPGALVACDLNLRGSLSTQTLAAVARLAHVVKLNTKEYEGVRQALSGAEPSEWLLARGRPELLVAVTSGETGAALITRHGEVSRRARRLDGLRDSVGAGDAFLAALVLATLEQVSLSLRLERACSAAEEQCRRRGGSPN